MDANISNRLTSRRRSWPAVKLVIPFLLGITLCLSLAESALCQGILPYHQSGPELHPKARKSVIPFPPADDAVVWEEGLFGKLPCRKKLADKGIAWSGVGQYQNAGNTTGGNRTGFASIGRTMLFCDLDFEKMCGLKGSKLRISGVNFYGNNIGDDVGTPYLPNAVYGITDTKLFELWFGQYFCDEQVHFKIGRLGLNYKEFGDHPLWWQFGSLGYDPIAGNAFVNNRAFTTWGFGQWGARLRIEPDDANYKISFGAYNTSETLSELQEQNGGFNFRFRPDEGVMYVAEYWYKRNHYEGDPGLPGDYRFGVLFDTGSYDLLDAPGQSERNNFGFYMIANQKIYDEGCCHCDSQQGLWAFASFNMNPDDTKNPFPYFFNWGLNYHGLFAGRDKDWTGFGNYHSFSSKNIPGNYETQFTVNHQFFIKPWMTLGPEIQYFHRPGGTGTIDDVLLLNLQSIISY